MQNTKKSPKKSPSVHHHTSSSGYIFATKARVDSRKKNLLSSNTSCTRPDNVVNFSPLAAEIDPVVWGTPANFNGSRVLAALLHGSQVLGVSQTLQRWTEGATYIRQGGHHVGHWPTFLVYIVSCCELWPADQLTVWIHLHWHQTRISCLHNHHFVKCTKNRLTFTSERFCREILLIHF